MFPSDYDAYLEGSRYHRDLVDASQRYRRMATNESGFRLIERLGARLIAVGRRLCERRGRLEVEVAFRGPDGSVLQKRHVA